jgi:hypothetical protein
MRVTLGRVVAGAIVVAFCTYAAATVLVWAAADAEASGASRAAITLADAQLRYAVTQGGLFESRLECRVVARLTRRRVHRVEAPCRRSGRSPTVRVPELAWSDMLARTRYPAQLERGLDGTSYIAANWSQGLGPRSGNLVA